MSFLCFEFVCIRWFWNMMLFPLRCFILRIRPEKACPCTTLRVGSHDWRAHPCSAREETAHSGQCLGWHLWIFLIIIRAFWAKDWNEMYWYYLLWVIKWYSSHIMFRLADPSHYSFRCQTHVVDGTGNLSELERKLKPLFGDINMDQSMDYPEV